MTEITRRSALRQGFGGIFLVCSFDFDKRKRAVGGTSAFSRVSARQPIVRPRASHERWSAWRRIPLATPPHRA